DGIRDFHVTGVQTCALPICLPHLRQLFLCGEAVIGVPRSQELPCYFRMSFGPLGLVNDLVVPVDAEPGEAVDDRLYRRLRRSDPIGVLDPQSKHPAVMTCEQPVEECGSCAADVEKTRR